ncbi:MAG: hypothetical protein M0P71_18590, partial [Melioribacteraceae bacterium]|nr:hypothetical protein [Melioribacteraceae bacterium]
MWCNDIAKPFLFFFSGDTPTLLYYSHLPTAVIALFLGLYVFLNNRRSISSKAFLFLNIWFSIFIISNLILWTNDSVSTITFIWPLSQISFVAVLLSFIYFFCTFIDNKDLGLVQKIFSVALLGVFSILAYTKFNFTEFNLSSCELMSSGSFLGLQNITFVVLSVWFITSFISRIRKFSPNINKRQLVLLFSAISLFWIMFIGFFQLAESGDYFNLEQYGLFGMTIFLALITYLIVKFKAFHIKLLWAQALVWALVILIGSQFAFVRNNTNKILTAVTLVISTILGLMLVRGVKREIAQREEIESLATNLEKANEGQSNLLHFITHQVKGYFTKSRNVFAELSTGDYGKLPEPVEIMVKEGFRSTTEGVDLVHNMLNAANIERGTMKYNKEDVDLKESLLDVIKQKKISIEEKGLKLITNIGEGNLVISG